MITVIRPLVQEPGHHRQARRGIAIYALGVLASALVAGAGWSLLGIAVQRLAPTRLAIVLLAAACLAMVLLDLGVRGARPLSVRRQTSSTWWRRFGPDRAWLYWGLDIGLGVTTYRATSLYWAAVLMIVLLVPAAYGPLVMVAYGLGLVVNLAVASLAIWRAVLLQPGGPHPIHFLRPVRLASAGLLAVLAAALLWVALA